MELNLDRKKYFKLQLLESSAKYLFPIIFYYWHQTLESLVIGIFIGYLISFVLLLFNLKGYPFKYQVRISNLKKYFSQITTDKKKVSGFELFTKTWIVFEKVIAQLNQENGNKNRKNFIPNLDIEFCPSYYCYIEGKLVLIYDLWSDIVEKPKYRKKLNIACDFRK